MPSPSRRSSPTVNTARGAREPSWAAVLATTVRLWGGRRAARIRRRAARMRPATRVTLGLALAAVIFAGGAVTVAFAAGAWPAGRDGSVTPAAGRPGEGSAGAGQGQPGSGQGTQPGAAQPGQGQGSAGNGPGGAGQGSSGAAPGGVAAAATVRAQAAAWVASRVSAGSIVGCDPAMCTALAASGVPAARLLALRAGQADPLGCDVLVATAAVRSMFGARLAGVYAPVTLAVFGRGASAVGVRVVAPDGAAAYRTALTADARERRAAGAQLASNPHIHASAAAQGQLTAGRVDARLLVLLATLSGLHPLDVVRFGGSSPGAGPRVPLRTAVIGADQAPGNQPPPVAELRTFLLAQRPPYRPLSVHATASAPRPGLLTVTYPAPSPLGLLGPAG